METIIFNPNELKDFIITKNDRISEYNLKRKKQWDEIRENNQHFLDTTKEFFSEYGIKIEFINNTEFNLKEAENGFYPYLRIRPLMLCFKVCDKGIITYQTLRYNYTEFIKKFILSKYKFN